jgi:trehalose/maltose transport system permease protein
VDGIHPVRVFFKITLPLIWLALMVAVIFRLLDGLRIFDLIYVLTSNSPDTMWSRSSSCTRSFPSIGRSCHP